MDAVNTMDTIGDSYLYRMRSAMPAVVSSVDGTNTASASATNGASADRLREVSREFEAIFIKQMLDSMRQSVDRSGLIDGGQSEEIFSDMLYDEYAGMMSRSAGFGLSDTIYQQLSSLQTLITEESAD